ncbi:MAG: DUF4360 domain-containing protein [Candidatus Electrothrix sp. ATG2]|nr:DUF4360 domain-containing protein [Candidatus Electrothrix sp. ATG2]
MFQQYEAEGPDSSSSRRSCNFAVPVHVPAGYQVFHLTADWRGFSIGETELTRQYFFAGQPASQIDKKTIFNEYNGIDFIEQDSLDPSYYTTCQRQARDVILRVNSAVEDKGGDGYILVDTIDKALVFELNWQECKDPVLPPILWLLLRSSP